jgi:hypothetical protein
MGQRGSVVISRPAPTAASTPRAASTPPLSSIEVDHLAYGHGHEKTWCIVSRLERRALPRNVVCMSGVVSPVCKLRLDRRFDYDTQVLICKPEDILQTLCIPSSVESVCRCAFHGCPCLSSVAFESSSKLSCLKMQVFKSCPLLACILIPSSVETLFPQCFGYCHSLSAVTFESGSRLAYISGFAFLRCSSLVSIRIPASVETLPTVAFYDCPPDLAITFEGSVTALTE